MLCEFDDIVKLRLDAGQPANIEPLKANLKPDAVAIWSKQRRYTHLKSEFKAGYVQELHKLGFIGKVTGSERVSARLVVPNQSLAMFRVTVNYRLVNAVRRLKFYPVPNIDAKLADTRGPKAFTGIDFCSK